MFWACGSSCARPNNVLGELHYNPIIHVELLTYNDLLSTLKDWNTIPEEGDKDNYTSSREDKPANFREQTAEEKYQQIEQCNPAEKDCSPHTGQLFTVKECDKERDRQTR